MSDIAGPLSGRAFAQIPGVRTSFVQGIGGMFGAAGSLVLAGGRAGVTRVNRKA